MANLGTFIIKNKTYMNIEDFLGRPLVLNKRYHIQVQNSAMLCPKIGQPKEDEGFYIKNPDLIYNFTVTENGLKLYVKNIGIGKTIINICD